MKPAQLFLLVLFFFSCRQSDVFGDIQPNTSRVIAEFTDAKTVTAVVQEATANVIEFDLTELRIDPRSVMQADARVRVIINPVVVTEYNSANGTSYTPVPASVFSLLSNQYKLTPDQRKIKIRAAMRPTDLLGGNYAVGLSIAEVSGGEIGSIGKNVLVTLSVKNKYDGFYRLKGFSNVPGTAFSGAFMVPCDEELGVVTSNVSSVALSPAQPVASGGSFVYINNLLPEISFHPQTNAVVSVQSLPGGIDLIYPFDASYNSRYDPATKTIYVKYGVAPVGSGRYIIDTLSYCGPR